MRNAKEACQVLGVPDRASAKEIEDAYRELMLIWEPERFSDAPEIQEKARQKRELVQEAFDFLRERSPLGADRPGETAEIPTGDPTARKGRPEVSTSLYDDIFSEKRSRKSRIPAYAIVLPILAVLLVLGVLFVPWGSDPVPLPEVIQPAETSGSNSLGGGLSEAGSTASGALDQGGAVDSTMPAAATREEASGPAAGTIPESAGGPPASTPEKPAIRPAPRRTAQVTERRTPQGTPSSAPGASSEEAPVKKTGGEPVDQTAEEAVPEDSIDEVATQAFETLKQTSLAAAKLVIGEAEDLAFREWKPVQRDGSKVLLDLTALRISDNRELHLIWQVDAENGKVTALSQAARDLEGRSRTP